MCKTTEEGAADKILREGKKLKDISVDELLKIKNCDKTMIGTLNLIVQEYNFRLTNGVR